ncbi:MAG: aminopeptidase [Burkholderiales bacterium]
MGKHSFRTGIFALLIGVIFAIEGCSTLSYYSQSASGQMEIVSKRRPITDVIADPATSPALRNRLDTVLRVREFASRELSLPDNQSYRGYADLERPYVVWNVFAAEEFSLKPREWCFPIAGCVGYKGYFAEADANAFAEQQKLNGLDVFIGSVTAYSTLGYFDDPVLNTFIHYPDWELARLIFHELAHQVAYVKDDSEFNESFATVVEKEGLRRWSAKHGDAKQEQTIVSGDARKYEFNQLLTNTKQKLESLFQTDFDATTKRARKKEIFSELLKEYEQKKLSWDGYKGFDRWINASTNNAVIAAFSIYTQSEPAFSALLVGQGNDLPKFYAAVKSLAKLEKSERITKLAVQKK